jgi:transforming growth factor-beta-induced protein
MFTAIAPVAMPSPHHVRSMLRRFPRLSVRTFRAALLATAAVTLVACGDDDDDPVGPTAPTQDIVALAASNGSLSTLVTAVQAAGLTGTLSGTGPFTVFAPTNTAFEALPAGTVPALLESGNSDVLTALLTYHVVPGTFTAAQLQDGQQLTTVAGRTLTVTRNGNTVLIDGVAVATADVPATNGVVHVIGGVLTEGLTAAERARVTPDLSTLVSALGAAELVDAVDGAGPITVFAPVNSAFAALPAEQIARLLEPANRDLLTKVLTYHVVAGEVRAADLTEGGTLTTLQGGTLDVSLQGGASINGRAVVAADIVTANGVVHLIDGVLTDHLDIVDVAVLNGFSSLVGAAVTADLGAALRGNGSGNGLTVFAPTNAAFEAIAAAVPSDPTELAQILLLHVVDGTALSTSLSNNQTLTTLQGGTLTVNIDGGTVTLTGPSNTVTVSTVDVPASNGVIHVLNAVILP